MELARRHHYAVEWTPDHVAFFVDGGLVTVVAQPPRYPMQFMLGTYAFPGPDGSPPPGPYPGEFVVERFRGYHRTAPWSAGAGRSAVDQLRGRQRWP